MPKFTEAERILVKSIIASLSIKRIPEQDIIDEVYRQTKKTLTKSGLFYIRKDIKKESYQWYKTMREGEYEYIHEFRERINEILDLQKRHYEIADSPTVPIPIKQASLFELHKLSVTLSNLFDVLRILQVILMLPYQLHQKIRQQSQKQQQVTSSSFDYKKLQKAFWIWDKKQHLLAAELSEGQCCWNHCVGFPIKNNKEYPLFDYKRILFNRLFVNEPNQEYCFKHKHLWCKKSTGLGVSEFILRIMGWLCTSTELYKNSITQMVIVTGPNQDLAIKLIKRLKAIFERKLGLTFNNKETVLELNGVEIQAYPSSNIDSFRSLTNPKFILLDESDFWIRDEVDEVRDVVERYIGKSDPYIVMVSTPIAPNGLFDRIEREPEDTCLYKRVKLDYTYGLNKIYTEAEIDKAKIITWIRQNTTSNTWVRLAICSVRCKLIE